MQFSKWHGLGNDYLLVERAELAFPLTPERVQKICDYHFGVGSDGIVEVAVDERRLGRDRDLEPRRLDRRAVRERHADRRALARAPGPASTGSGSGSGRARWSARCATGSRSRRRWAAVEVGEPETLEVEGEDRDGAGLGRQPARGHPRRCPTATELLRLGPLSRTTRASPSARTSSSCASTARTT